MWLSKENFPILENIKNNRLIKPLTLDGYYNPNVHFVFPDDIYDDEMLDTFHQEFNNGFKIHYITKSIEDLLKGNSFDKARTLIDQLPDCCGLILHRDFLLTDLFPDFEKLEGAIEDIWYCVKSFDEYADGDPDLLGKKAIYIYFNHHLFQSTHELLSLRGQIMIVDEPIQKFVVNFLLFYHFTEPTIKEVMGGTSTKKLILKDDRIINDSPNSIEIIDENFFKTIIRTDGFGVNGHFRLQPVGKNKTNRKLIYIEPFQKNGYTRIAKSLS